MFGSKFSKFCALLLVFGILFSACPISYATTGKQNSIQQVCDKNGNTDQERKHDEQELSKKDIDNTQDGENLITKLKKIINRRLRQQ